MRKERCSLMEEAYHLVEKRKLDKEKLHCPYEEPCDGTFCPMIEEEPASPVEIPTQTEKFRDKLEKSVILKNEKKEKGPRTVYQS